MKIYQVEVLIDNKDEWIDVRLSKNIKGDKIKEKLAEKIKSKNRWSSVVVVQYFDMGEEYEI